MSQKGFFGPQSLDGEKSSRPWLFKKQFNSVHYAMQGQLMPMIGFIYHILLVSLQWEPVQYFNNKIICDLVEEKFKGIISILVRRLCDGYKGFTAFEIKIVFQNAKNINYLKEHNKMSHTSNGSTSSNT